MNKLSLSSSSRLFGGACLLIILASSGCGWVRIAADSGQSAEQRPVALEPRQIAQPEQRVAASGNSVVVERGDTIASIARRHRVGEAELIALNGLQVPYALEPGSLLQLPARDAPGTIGSASASAPSRGAVESEPLPLRPAEPVARPRPMSATAPAPAKPATPRTTVAAAPPQAPAKPAAVAASPKPAPAARPVSAVASSGKFLKPVDGRVVSGFGTKPGGGHNDGINIAASRGTAVRAAQDGTVAYAGNELPGFGNLVLIKHADGWVTAYGHNDEVLVAKGDSVTRGQPIARVGSTGSVTEPQLHFELRRGSKAVDPTPYLGTSEARAESGGNQG